MEPKAGISDVGSMQNCIAVLSFSDTMPGFCVVRGQYGVELVRGKDRPVQIQCLMNERMEHQAWESSTV